MTGSLNGIPKARQPSVSAKTTGDTLNAKTVAGHIETALGFADQAAMLAKQMVHENKPQPAEDAAPAKLEGNAKLEEHAQAEEHAETAAAPKPERFFAGSKLEGTVGFLRKINPVLGHAMTKAEEARAAGDNVALGALKGYGGALYNAGKGVVSGVSTAVTSGVAVEALNPIGLAALVGTSAYLGASKESADAPDLLKKAAKLI